jgi:hypothetical protein
MNRGNMLLSPRLTQPNSSFCRNGADCTRTAGVDKETYPAVWLQFPPARADINQLVASLLDSSAG